MLVRRFSRALVPLGLACAGLLATGGVAAAAPDATVCFDASLARARTEIDTDLEVAQFDPTLGTLLEVTVTGPSAHLDTDAVFESTAASAVTFAEHMDYQIVVGSPGGLASPGPIAGTIPRIPSQTLAPFDGTLDFLGPSAVVQPSIARDDSVGPTSTTDPAVLGVFTGSGTMAFHLTSTISETFTGGGGNVQAIINTFASATVRICYRYAPIEVAGVVTTPALPAPPPAPPAPPPSRPPRLAFTGSPDGLLAVVGAGLLTLGVFLAARARGPRPTLDA